MRCLFSNFENSLASGIGPMAHAIRYEARHATVPDAPKAKALRQKASTQPPQPSLDPRTTRWPAGRRSGTQALGERPARRMQPAKVIEEEVVADLSKDPRHEP